MSTTFIPKAATQRKCCLLWRIMLQKSKKTGFSQFHMIFLNYLQYTKVGKIKG